MHGDDVATQLLLNNHYRTLIGVRRADHIRISELADHASCPTLNEIMAKQAAVAAWRSQNRGPLDDILKPCMIGLGELPWRKESLLLQGASLRAI